MSAHGIMRSVGIKPPPYLAPRQFTRERWNDPDRAPLNKPLAVQARDTLGPYTLPMLCIKTDAGWISGVTRTRLEVVVIGWRYSDRDVRLSPIKVHETRGWDLRHRGELVVHATKTLVSDCGADFDDLLIRQFGTGWRSSLTCGALIGVVSIAGSSPVEQLPHDHKFSPDFVAGDYSRGRFAIRRSENFKIFKTPIPYRGRQRNLFDVPDDLVREALAA